MKILVTGGAGFIGSNFIRYIHGKYPDYRIINLDKLTYAGNLENLEDISGHSFYRFIKGDITDASLVGQVLEEGIDVLVNFAAESHVDRSIEDAASFIRTNILGTQVLLEASKQHKVGRFLQKNPPFIPTALIQPSRQEQIIWWGHSTKLLSCR